MAGLAEPIRLREFTNKHPQINIEDVHPGKTPITGKTLHGLYVGEVGRRHPADPNQISYKLHFDQTIPDFLDLPTVTHVSHETLYNRTYKSHFVNTDFKYTPTSYFRPLPIGAKSSPDLLSVRRPTRP
ncbi:uncharacterized protein LOC120346245 isoform X2 [Styela clava]|uniref:uncharacterized protein LOC120346245 n=1 Tax=Styela clava TaxID=7725 RepID=UPI00193A8045|nr:uncharacterized protein LOC120346245 [Styela clava]